MGAEKFFDIKCRKAGLKPDAVVLVATVRALKYNGGVPRAELENENLEALANGIVNLEKHIENIQKYGVPVVVAINRFETDSDGELQILSDFCAHTGCRFALSEVFAHGGDGGKTLAEAVVEACAEPSDFRVLYDAALPVKEKILAIATQIYGAGAVAYTPAAEKMVVEIETLGKSDLPVCIAKTQYSLSDDPSKLGRPSGFTLNVKEIRLSAGAGFIVALTGDIMTMPGLPKAPAACQIDVGADGRISGLF